MKKYSIINILLVATILFFGCKKVEDKKDLYKAPVAIATPISDAGCLGSDPVNNAVKGTMLAGKTYTVCGDIFVNEKDTLIIQEGVTVNFTGKYGIGVRGTFICLGTKAKPNVFTFPGAVKTDTYGADPNVDPALNGQWIGIIGGATCPLMIFKWTHVEFGGAAIPATSGIKQVYTSPYPVFFQNPNGVFVMEDSWLYGSKDDPLRILGGKASIMRNTFEKCGYTGGEALNGKAGLRGDFAYNLCIGMATNGPKLSNAGAVAGVPGSNMRIYNNTIINCGYRRSSAGRGGSINFEEGAGGMAYNNLIINCKFGLRVVQNPIADTANLRYGYNYTYADSTAVANNIYPTSAISVCISNAPATDMPTPSSFLPVDWTPGATYSANPAILGANNPQFVNAPCPMPAGLKLRDISFVGNYDFRLKSTSPCIGKGYIGFSPRADVPVDLIYGATEITPPGKDIGAFQSNGYGNQH
ncbi:MAG: hypothetical protein ABJB11_18805 [Ferruginibacter sp.]